MCCLFQLMLGGYATCPHCVNTTVNHELWFKNAKKLGTSLYHRHNVFIYTCIPNNMNMRFCNDSKLAIH